MRRIIFCFWFIVGAASCTGLSPRTFDKTTGPNGPGEHGVDAGIDAGAGGIAIPDAIADAAAGVIADAGLGAVSDAGATPVTNDAGIDAGASADPPDQGWTGSMATDYLGTTRYRRLIVEVDYVRGNAPNAGALSLLKQRLEERCNKPDGITVTVDTEIPPQSTTRWGLADLRALERQYRGRYSSGDTAVLYFLYVAGGYEGDTNNSRVLGVSHTGSSIAMFKEAMRDSATALLTGNAIEEAVIVHEAGHNLGMVGNGLAMQRPHQDAAHGAHDTNQSCVMYWAVETSLVSQLLGTVPNNFDADCIADMRAAGGR